MLFTVHENSYYVMKIGVFALQGAFIEHEHALQKLGAEVVEIRRLAHFSEQFDGVVLPGGESTVQGKLLREEGLFAPLKSAIEGGMPVLATCAGLILLANKIEGGEAPHLQTLNVTVRRNAYGRQLGSFTANTEVKGIGEYPAVFIRAPYVSEAGEGVDVLSVVGSKTVAVRQGKMLALAFHPELTDDLRVHEYFLKMIKGEA